MSNETFVPQIDPQTIINNSTEELCSNCAGKFFKQTLMFRRLPAIIAMSKTDQLIPIPVFRCDDCGTPISDMIPTDEPIEETKSGRIIKLEN